MRSIAEAAGYGPSQKLIKAVIKQLGYTTKAKAKAKDKDKLESTLRDVMNHGADGGFGNFCYYTDTCKFYQRNKKDILALLKNQASDFGAEGGVIGMVKGFKCAADEDEDAIGRTLYGSAKQAEQGVENCLAWYALEEVARAMCDE